jgi:hypothetical protein
MKHEIKFLHNEKIDLVKWDSAIVAAPNSRCYALSWYLDVLEPDWLGIVVDEYTHIMPLIIRKKWGIRYAYQPTFAQQHGIFPTASAELTQQIILELSSHFNYIDINLNSQNQYTHTLGITTPRNNYILSLNKSYAEISNTYTDLCTRNIKTAHKKNEISRSVTLEEFMKVFRENVPVKLPSQKFITLKKIIYHALMNHSGHLYGAYSKQNELTGVAFFLKDKNRYYYISSSSTFMGRKNQSMYAILDQFIHDHCEEPFIFDFEGSMIDGVSKFFAGFGATTETYPNVKINLLPWPVNLLKQ